MFITEVRVAYEPDKYQGGFKQVLLAHVQPAPDQGSSSHQGPWTSSTRPHWMIIRNPGLQDMQKGHGVCETWEDVLGYGGVFEDGNGAKARAIADLENEKHQLQERIDALAKGSVE